MKRKNIILALLLICVISLLCGVALIGCGDDEKKATVRGGGLTYEKSDDETCFIVTGLDSNDYSNNVVIPAAINGLPVSYIGKNAFSNTDIISISIPKSIKYILSDAFSGCKNLKTLNIENLESWCNIRFITSGSNPGSKAENVYVNDKLLTDLVIPDSITEIEDYAFYGFKNLESVRFNDKQTSINDYAFSGCSNLTTITIPNCVKYIYDYAFSDCSNLISVTIGENVKSIERGAFDGCSNLIEVCNLSELAITTQTWGNGSKQYAINVYTATSGQSNLHQQGDFYFYEEGSTVYLMRYLGSDKQIVLPENFNNKKYEIYKKVFSESDITSITFSKGISGIGENAFYKCSNLTNILIPDGITKIEGYTFACCTSLVSVSISDTVQSIGYSAFYDCENLVNVKMGKNVKSIDGSAFKDCIKLTSITIPSGVTKIEDGTFNNCCCLENIIIPGGVTSIGNWAFAHCEALESIVIPASVTQIGDLAFYDCKKLKVVYYGGTSSDWQNIKIGNQNEMIKIEDRRYYYSESEPQVDEETKKYIGNYWHYDKDGVTPIIWKK